MSRVVRVVSLDGVTHEVMVPADQPATAALSLLVASAEAKLDEPTGEAAESAPVLEMGTSAIEATHEPTAGLGAPAPADATNQFDRVSKLRAEVEMARDINKPVVCEEVLRATLSKLREMRGLSDAQLLGYCLDAILQSGGGGGGSGTERRAKMLQTAGMVSSGDIGTGIGSISKPCLGHSLAAERVLSEKTANPAASASEPAPSLARVSSHTPKFDLSRTPMMISTFSDTEPLPPPRVQVDDVRVPWHVPFDRYQPSDWTRKKIAEAKNGMADPTDPREIEPAAWEARQRRSSQAVIHFDPSGRPRNPIGRTGITGRGALFHWGPNFASDLVVTRWKPDATGILELLCLPHAQSAGVLALLGGILKKDDKDFASKPLEQLAAHLLTPAAASKADVKALAAKVEALPGWAERVLQRGYVDDPRATDNAWLESTFYHLHMDPHVLDRLELTDERVRADVLQPSSCALPRDTRWVTVMEDETELRQILTFGDHARAVVKARHRLMPPIKIEPLVTSRLVSLQPLGRGASSSAEIREIYRRKGLMHLTGLVDEHSFSRTFYALWIDAGRPTFSEVAFPTADGAGDEDLRARIEEFMKDRRNWSQFNLHRFVAQAKLLQYDHGVQALIALRKFTTLQYRSVISMPMYVLSLEKCNNISPYHETLIATDQLECLSNGLRPTYFHLSTDVFETGSLLVSRATLRKVRHLVEPEGETLQHLEIDASPLSPITLDGKSRALAGIPEEAVFFCVSFPFGPLTGMDALSSLDEDELRSAEADPFMNFLLVGSYMYFDSSYHIVGVMAFCFRELDADALPQGFALKKTFYGRPCPLPKSAIRPLNQLGRWRTVTVDYIRSSNFTHFAWIKPSEFLGDHVFPKNGGFAYLHHNWQESQFYPIVTPYDDSEVLDADGDGVGDEGSGRLLTFDLAADGDANNKPREFDAPLHIPDFNDFMATQSMGPSHDVAASEVFNDKFISDMTLGDIGDDEQAAAVVMADAAQSARGVEQQLGFRDTAELLGHRDMLLEDWSYASWLTPEVRSRLALAPLEGDAAPDDCEETIRKIAAMIAKFSLHRVMGIDQRGKVTEEKMASMFAKIDANKDGVITLEEWRAFLHSRGLSQEKGEAFEDMFRQLDADGSGAIDKAGFEANLYASQHRRFCKVLVVEVCDAIVSMDLKGAYAREMIDNLHYVLCDRAGEQRVASNDTSSTIIRDRGRTDNEDLDAFAKMREATECNLTVVEVAALRLYTTSTFRLINNPLRQSASKTKEELHEKKHPLAVTTYHITTGLKKLRALNFRSLTKDASTHDSKLQETESAPSEDSKGTNDDSNKAAKPLNQSYLWRGLKDMTISDRFMSYGGSELACMSTSENLSTIAGYSLSKCPLLFRIKIESPMDRGANLKWLSTFPDEEEVLYPPLTYLQPLLKQKIRGFDGGLVVTLKAVFPS